MLPAGQAQSTTRVQKSINVDVRKLLRGGSVDEISGSERLSNTQVHSYEVG